MDNQELIEQNTGLRRSMADTSDLLDRAYGPSGERLELRIARLIKVEQGLRAELAAARALKKWTRKWQSNHLISLQMIAAMDAMDAHVREVGEPAP